MGWRRGSGGCFLSRRTRNYRVTRLKLVRGKAFPSSSDHEEAAEPRRGAGGSAAWLELLLLPRFLADLALHKPAPRLESSPAKSASQQGVLGGGSPRPQPQPCAGLRTAASQGMFS